MPRSKPKQQTGKTVLEKRRVKKAKQEKAVKLRKRQAAMASSAS